MSIVSGLVLHGFHIDENIPQFNRLPRDPESIRIVLQSETDHIRRTVHIPVVPVDQVDLVRCHGHYTQLILFSEPESGGCLFRNGFIQRQILVQKPRFGLVCVNHFHGHIIVAVCRQWQTRSLPERWYRLPATALSGHQMADTSKKEPGMRLPAGGQLTASNVTFSVSPFLSFSRIMGEYSISISLSS